MLLDSPKTNYFKKGKSKKWKKQKHKFTKAASKTACYDPNKSPTQIDETLTQPMRTLITAVLNIYQEWSINK